MRTDEKSPITSRGWLWCAVGCVAITMVVVACSRQSAPASPSMLMSHSEVEHVHGDSGLDASRSVAVASDLAAIRAATAKYHDISVALADGYKLGYQSPPRPSTNVVAGCISNPTAGAMGYHYFNWDRMDDPTIVAGEPEVLVYHKADDGTLVLGAVEWVVPKPVWEQAGNSQPPVVFGQTLHVLNPVLNWYITHAWIWTHNPSGMFADWNPEVSCP